MKVEVEAKPFKFVYPYIGRNKNGVIVMFLGTNTGICLSESEDNSIGEYAKNWAEETFAVFEGKLTLSNY